MTRLAILRVDPLNRASIEAALTVLGKIAAGEPHRPTCETQRMCHERINALLDDRDKLRD